LNNPQHCTEPTHCHQHNTVGSQAPTGPQLGRQDMVCTKCTSAAANTCQCVACRMMDVIQLTVTAPDMLVALPVPPLWHILCHAASHCTCFCFAASGGRFPLMHSMLESSHATCTDHACPVQQSQQQQPSCRCAPAQEQAAKTMQYALDQAMLQQKSDLSLQHQTTQQLVET
jgi:hypothetical protein